MTLVCGLRKAKITTGFVAEIQGKQLIVYMDHVKFQAIFYLTRAV